MLDIGATELLMVVIVAVVVIGPKDMPLAMRTAGRWIGKLRKVTGHFRAGIDAMVREAELEEMEQKWREQNEAIMKAAPKLPTAEEMEAPRKAKTDAEKANNVEGDAPAEPEALPAPEPASTPSGEVPAPSAATPQASSEPQPVPASDPARPAS